MSATGNTSCVIDCCAVSVSSCMCASQHWTSLLHEAVLAVHASPCPVQDCQLGTAHHPNVAAACGAERERITVSNLASTMVNMLVNNPLLPLLDLSSLRLMSCGGSPQSPQVIAQAVAAFGCEFFVSYGMTECCGKISMSLLPWREGWWAQVGLDKAWQLVNTSGRPFLLMEVSSAGPRPGGGGAIRRAWPGRCGHTGAFTTLVAKGIAVRGADASDHICCMPACLIHVSHLI